MITPSSTIASIILNAVGPDTPIKVTIAWTDLEGISQPAVVHSLDNLSAPVLRNNINLTVRKIGSPSITYYPWTPDPGSPWPSTAGTGVNHRDNVEQVLIPATAGIVANGQYEIKIMPQPYGLVGSQWVSVAISGLNLPSGPAEGTILSSGFQTFSGTTHLYTLTFKSAFGGYYKVQYYSYNVNDGWKWRDGTGIIYAKAASTNSGFYVSSNQPNPFPTRVLTSPPDPFAPLPP